MKVLIVDNNMHIAAYPQGLMIRSCLPAPFSFTATVRKPNQLSEHDANVDRVILTGSTSNVREEREWMTQERTFIEKWMKKNIPIFSICFGAQLLARHLYGEKAVEAMPIPISGSIDMNRKDDVPLFDGLPESFGVTATHYEGFIVPSEKIIASTREWPNYAFAYNPITYGVQFHPELMGTVGKNVVKVQRLFFDRHVYQEFVVKTRPQFGKRIVKNFLQLPARGQV